MANEEILRLRTTIQTEEGLAQLRALGREIGFVGTKGAPGIKTIDTAFGNLTKTVKNLTGEVLKAAPALGGLGLGAAGIGLAFGAVIRTMNDVSARVVGLKNLSADLGMSIQQIKGFQQAADEAGSSPEAASQALQAAVKNIEDFKRRIGSVREELYANRAGDFVEAVVGAKDPQAAINNAFGRIRKMIQQGRIADAKDFSRLFFGTSDVLHYMDQVEDAQRHAKVLTEEQQQALVKYHSALKALGDEWSDFQDKLAAGISPKLTQDLKDIKAIIELMDKVGNWLGLSPGQDPIAALSNKMLHPFGGKAGDRAPNQSPRSGYQGPASAPTAPTPDAGSFLHPQNRNPRSGYKPASFGGFSDGFGGGGSDLSEGSRMVKEGVFQALIDFKSYVEAGGQGGGGFANASFGGSGGAAAGGGAGGRGGGAASFGGGGYTNLTPGTGGGTAGAEGKSAPSPGEAAEANKNVTGVGGYNFMGSKRAADMGMGDVTPGSAAARQTFNTGIPKGQGPQSITANKYAGGDMANFLRELHESGAPLKDFSGVYANRSKRGGGGASQHAYGNAIDIEGGFGSGPDNSPALYAWAQKNPEKWKALKEKYHLRNLAHEDGARMNDWGHLEWTPDGKKTPEAASANAGPTGGGGSAADRKTVKGSWFGNAPGWRDPSEDPRSPKSNRPGIALRDKSTIGQMFEVTDESTGKKYMLPQTDYGPAARTGRGIDITAAAGAQMGYTSKNFPTNGAFSYRRIDNATNTAANGGVTKAEGNVNVTVNSNGTAAKTTAEADGLWQKSTVQNYRQMQPTSTPAGRVASGHDAFAGN